MMVVFWPAFVGAAASTGAIFSVLDPLAIEAVRVYLGGSREGAYTVAFLALWCLHAMPCALTWLLASTAGKMR